MEDKPKKKSKYKGVTWHTNQQRWIVQLQAKGNKKTYGSFKDERAAAIAYDKKVIQLGLNRPLNILKPKTK